MTVTSEELVILVRVLTAVVVGACIAPSTDVQRDFAPTR
jgi:hypothetical protein